MSRALLILISAVSAFAQPVGSGTIQGSVRNEVTGAGIPQVHVTLFTRQAVRYETDTDAAGAFLVTGVAAGTYQARLQKDGYTPATDQGTAVIGVFPTARMNLTMSGSVTVRGRVIDRDGNLVKGASARLLDFSGLGLSSPGPEFEFKEVRPAYYTLLAIPSPGTSKFTPTYYPSSADPSGALRVPVLGDRDVEGLEIRMETGDSYRVSGKVVSDAGDPVKNVRVTLHPMIHHSGRMTGGNTLTVYPPGENTGPAEQDVESRDGTFIFNNVRNGDWTITAVVGLRGDVINMATVRSNSAAVGVYRGDVEDVEIRLMAPVPVAGSIEWEGSPPRNGLLLATSATGQNTLIGPPVTLNTGQLLTPNGGGSESRKDGSFKLLLQPGRMYLTLPETPGFYPASLTVGGQEMLGLPIDVTTGLGPIHGLMKPATGVIRGQAEPGTAFVVLIPAPTDRAGFGREAFPSADGTFEMKDVAPGYYTIAAFGPPRSLDPSILEKARALGTQVHIEDTNPIEVKLTLLKWLE